MTTHKKKIGHTGLLIDYTDRNLPPIRAGVEMIPVSHEAQKLIYFHDPEGYLEKPFVLDNNVAALLPLLNGNHSVQSIRSELLRYGNEVGEPELLTFVRQLDEARLLHSPWFRQYRDSLERNFEGSNIRPPVCAGQSYPSDPAALIEMLRNAFSIARNGSNIENFGPGHDGHITNGLDKVPAGKVKALFAPHIDPRVGLNAYIPAFRPLADLHPSRVVLLATSHYSGMFHPLYEGYPYITSRKNFETPLGIIPTDQKALDELQKHAIPCGCSFQDRAHRNEHSIELHLIFLQYLWSHPFQLVPILVGSLEELYYQKSGEIGKKVDAMAAFLNKQYGKDEDTLFLISGDLAHIGRKFGDRRPASEMFEEVKTFDRTFLEEAKTGNNSALLDLIMESYDPYRICGFPPLYTALSALPTLQGKVTSYELWDEKEQESAVTYGSLLYHQTP